MDTESLPLGGPLSSELLDFFVVFGAILLVVLIAFFWALMVRKGGKSRRKHRSRQSYREQLQKGASEIRQLIREHRSGRRREHRPINPTLAQTGGLPPLREAEKPPPPPQP
jgi:hypothetical protein